MGNKKTTSFNKLIIATNVNGVPEMIEDQTHGFLFDPGDVKKLSQILHKVYLNFSNYQDITQNARSKVKDKYLIQSFIDNIQNIYINTACEK